MRKWMRDRLQRRKKKEADEAPSPSAPPPLQPAYFEADQESAKGADAEQGEPETVAASEPEPEAVSVEGSSEPTEAAPSRRSSTGEGQRGRGRRRRGGRGRGGRGREQAVAQAFAPKSGTASEGTQSPEDGADVAEPQTDVEPAVEAEAAAETVAPRAPAVPAVVPSAPGRPPKGIVVLAIGLPGSGKSSWFKRHNLAPLSSDMMRALLFDDVREQRFQDLVFSNLRSMLKARLIAKRPMNYVDATNLTPQERQHWIKLAKDYNYEVHAVFFDVPLEVCIERHQRRDRVVPEDIMRRMAAKLKPPSFDEGFAKITVVRVKKKDLAS
jgi:predicted kinase